MDVVDVEDVVERMEEEKGRCSTKSKAASSDLFVRGSLWSARQRGDFLARRRGFAFLLLVEDVLLPLLVFDDVPPLWRKVMERLSPL